MQEESRKRMENRLKQLLAEREVHEHYWHPVTFMEKFNAYRLYGAKLTMRRYHHICHGIEVLQQILGAK